MRRPSPEPEPADASEASAGSPSSGDAFMLLDRIDPDNAVPRAGIIGIVPVREEATAGGRWQGHGGGRLRWFGLAATVLVHALVGIGLILTISGRPMRHAAQPALTVVDLRLPVAPVPPPEEDETETPPIPPAETIRQPEPVEPPPPVVRNPVAMVAPPPAPVERAAEPVLVPDPPPPAPPASDGQDSWEGRVLAALNRYLRYPRNALARREQGAPLIRFVMDRDGRVMSVGLRRTSGSADLDREALSLPTRAQPLPKPPDDRPGATLELVVPIQFFLHGR
ncbi:energy transducer TonB [Sphingobium chlorophenolicum]|nr:TonB family protein [Sphingobium chlorophenolicum]